MTSQLARRAVAVLVMLLIIGAGGVAHAQNSLPSWNGGPVKKAIFQFVRETTDKSSPKFVPPEGRIATFDQDGTLWVEHPISTQVVYCLERIPTVVAAKPELTNLDGRQYES